MSIRGVQHYQLVALNGMQRNQAQQSMLHSSEQSQERPPCRESCCKVLPWECTEVLLKPAITNVPFLEILGNTDVHAQWVSSHVYRPDIIINIPDLIPIFTSCLSHLPALLTGILPADAKRAMWRDEVDLDHRGDAVRSTMIGTFHGSSTLMDDW